MSLSPVLPSHIKGLVFDCDGTLANTMPLHWRAWQAITDKYKLKFPEDRFYSLGGLRSSDNLPMMSYVEPIYAVVEIAQQNHGRIPMAVASGGTQSVIIQVLEHLKIRHL